MSSALVVPPEVKPPDLAALVEKTLQRGQRASSWKPKLKEKKVMPYFCRLSNIKAEGKKCSAEKSHPRTPERPPGGGVPMAFVAAYHVAVQKAANPAALQRDKQKSF